MRGAIGMAVVVALGGWMLAPRTAQGHPATKVVDGLCHESPQDALARLDADIRAVRDAEAKQPCVAATSNIREREERKELESLADAVTSAVADQCAKTNCVSNLYLPLCKLEPWGPSCFGGCSNFSLVADEAVGAPRYFSKQRVHQCAVLFCHWVVVLTNDRTGEQYVLDAWRDGGGAVVSGGNPLKDIAGYDRNPLRTIDEFRTAYPNAPPFWSESDPKSGGLCKRGLFRHHDPLPGEVEP